MEYVLVKLRTSLWGRSDELYDYSCAPGEEATFSRRIAEIFGFYDPFEHRNLVVCADSCAIRKGEDGLRKLAILAHTLKYGKDAVFRIKVDDKYQIRHKLSRELADLLNDPELIAQGETEGNKWRGLNKQATLAYSSK